MGAQQGASAAKRRSKLNLLQECSPSGRPPAPLVATDDMSYLAATASGAKLLHCC